jgi:alkyl sulfatase BDS1-like metallo-beta-lactamase superfamily hydrolase
MNQSSVLELAEKLWHGEVDLSGPHHPVNAAELISGEVRDGVFLWLSLASATAIDTKEGLVFLDTGGPWDAKGLFDTVRAWRKDPMVAAIFSHHHIDHVFGTSLFEAEASEKGWPTPLVWGHEGLNENFDRYMKTLGYNARINERQFGLPEGTMNWPENWRRPDVTYESQAVFTRGGCTFELHHARGETNDATWTYVPELKILHAGDLFIWAVPNAGNPQKVQRYAGDWAKALREMSALGAEIMIPGHGVPVIGAERIRQALGNTAELLESLEAQTLGMMNEGCTLDEVIHGVRVPEHLASIPYLQAIYDHPQFLVRNIWRLYGGWYDGQPDHLLPAPVAEQAAVWISLAGGIPKVLEKAKELSFTDPRLASHLVEAAYQMDPSSLEVNEVRAQVYELRSHAESSSMASNIFKNAANQSRAKAGGTAQEV